MPAEEAVANDNRPEAEHRPDAGKKLAIVTTASSIASREQVRAFFARMIRPSGALPPEKP